MKSVWFISIIIIGSSYIKLNWVKAVEQSADSNLYYVDSEMGNDIFSGQSPDKAWKTLEKVNSRIFSAGDKILFRSGRVYIGQLKPHGSGTKANPIKVDKYGEGAKPELRSDGLVDATLYLYNVEGWEIQNLSISNSATNRKAKRYGIHVELKDFGTSQSIKLKNLDVHDVNGSLVKKEGGGAGIVFSNSGDRIKSNFDGILVENCTIKRTSRNGILVNGNWERTKWLPNRNVIIRKNLLEGVPGDGIVPIGCDSALIEYNIMRDCPRLLPDGEAAAGIWPWSSDNTIIQYNEVSDHKAPWDAQGFDSDWNCRNTIIQYNYSHDNEGGFILICDDGGADKSASIGNNGTIVRYNLSVNDGLRSTGKHAGFSPVIHIAGPVKNTKVYNNVLYIPVKPVGIDSNVVDITDWQGYSDSTVFANNIFYANAKVSYSLNKGSRTIFENNIYYGIQLNKQRDSSALLINPGFIFKGPLGLPGLKSVENFQLSINSPAIGKGKIMVSKTIKDFFGNTVNNTVKPTIGLHQVN